MVLVLDQLYLWEFLINTLVAIVVYLYQGSLTPRNNVASIMGQECYGDLNHCPLSRITAVLVYHSHHMPIASHAFVG